MICFSLSMNQKIQTQQTRNEWVISLFLFLFRDEAFKISSDFSRHLPTVSWMPNSNKLTREWEDKPMIKIENSV